MMYLILDHLSDDEKRDKTQFVLICDIHLYIYIYKYSEGIFYTPSDIRFINLVTTMRR